MERTKLASYELRGVAVYDQKKPDRKIGKVHSFVFHPNKRRVIGFTVKRPDVALMFHRAELFVALDSFDITENGHVMILDKPGATDNAACKRLGVKWDECIIWQGLPLLAENGKSCGYVGGLEFSFPEGALLSIHIDKGATSELILGSVDIPASYVKGFQFGVGENLSATEEDDFMRGAIIVSDEVLAFEAEGGLAEKAGRGAAIAKNKAADAAVVAKDKAEIAAEKANETLHETIRPKADEAVEKASDAMSKGAFAVGMQLHKTKGMFSSFKEEYRKALEETSEEKSTPKLPE